MVTVPALYECVVTHVRPGPVRNAFRYGTYLWLVDLDALPGNRLLASFESRDHAGSPRRTIRANLEDFLGGHGVDLRGGRILMLTNARVLGHVFNPLTVYWCHDPRGALACVVAEVHNTYGGRHRYLLRPDAAGRARTAKEFYVSPFYPVEGAYRMSLPVPAADLALTIALHRDGERPFVAGLRGRGRPATRRALLGMALRHPAAPLAAAARMRLQGIRLYLRGLPIVPRPSAGVPAGVQQRERA
ncbi:DUF1365 domain-containing protein [Actinomadura scrupuli]|uniref:DUF1365 domain-containing protein n=1 Tax=Actinomadura scrupuli TaxID=559629 RepID=UPI003D978F4C